MVSRRWVPILLTSIVALASCTHHAPAPAVSAPSVTSAEVAAHGQSSYASAGRRLAIRLSTPLSTALSSAGETFSAQVLTPLLAEDGKTVLVPAGATVIGHVAETDFGGASPWIRLGFDAVQTKNGLAPLSVSIVDAQSYLVGGSSVQPAPAAPAEEAVVRRARHVVLPAGARIDLMLARPFQAPPAPPPARQR